MTKTKPARSWAEQTLDDFKSYVELDDLQELIKLLEAYLEEKSQREIKL